MENGYLEAKGGLFTKESLAKKHTVAQLKELLKKHDLKVSGKKSGAVFTISDQGKGIDPSRIPDIFDGKANKISSDSSRGLGIGLSICKSIILAYDGKIFAAHNISGGARFTFVLPMKGDTDNA